MRKSIFTVLAAPMLLGAASIAAPAAAEERVSASVTVSFADLDLTKPAGLATLEGRIKAAVNQVCAKVEPRRLWTQVAWEQCKAETLADAMEQLAALAPSPSLALAASEN